MRRSLWWVLLGGVGLAVSACARQGGAPAEPLPLGLDHLLALSEKLHNDRLTRLHDREIAEQTPNAVRSRFQRDRKRIACLNRLAKRAALHLERQPEAIENGLSGG